MAPALKTEVVFEDEAGNTLVHQLLSDLGLDDGPCEWDICPAPGIWLGHVLNSDSAANGWTICQAHLTAWEASRS
jgi:hypothetical protein